MYGSIDFMCAPHFDSASVFAALLDDQRDGRFQLAPLLEDARQKQLYLPDTCVLLSRFLSDDGLAEVSDFMPIGDERQAYEVVRRAKTVRGEARFRMVCQPLHRRQHERAPAAGAPFLVSVNPTSSNARLPASTSADPSRSATGTRRSATRASDPRRPTSKNRHVLCRSTERAAFFSAI
jgi:trehalase-like protein